MIRTKNIFISHSWAYGDAYEKIMKMLKTDTNTIYKNYSVPLNDPIHNAPNKTALYEAIKRQISPCSVVIILAGVYSTYSEWINKEIIIANTEFLRKKPIIAIQPWGAERTSTVVKKNADIIVGWNTSSIVKAIKQLS